MKAIQKTPPKSFTDALTELTGWIEKREFSLDKSPFIVNDAAQMEKHISQLKVGFEFIGLSELEYGVVLLK